ncbi:MAG: transcription antitermination factor NusB [Deltaproteobacteria bacterium]|nr:transcription antitermination factor NusB [Deltaproteobacteria bacterium]MBW2199554.1 transcription antitermination factor NusB [Deltaproteobacteria bacterium]MBW2538172.1 transcription antitermination factor NusB [Deltaproteobacteria bacterium]
MGNRRRSRELAMQALFYVDMRQNKSKEILDLYLQSFTPSKKVLPFFLELVNGVIGERDRIDTMIKRFSSNWKMSRMSCVDRNIMRIAVYEMLYCGDIPLKVSINEAIDVGKKFGTEESGAFINGILDSVRLVLEEEEIKIETEVHTDETH